MTVEQFAILGMLAKEGVTFTPKNTVELDDQKFIETLRELTRNTYAPPYAIAPGLISRYDGADYKFDLYKFEDFRLNIYYSLSMGVTMFTISGEVGGFVILRRWER